MGYRLRRMVRDGAPPKWTALMRLVASEIADDARDPDPDADGDALPWSVIGVEGHWDEHGVWHDGLAEICGVTPRAISDALTGLARGDPAKGVPPYEMRRQLGTDKRGKPIYAYKGRAMQFIVPPLPPRKPPERPHSDATFADAPAQGRPHSDAPFTGSTPQESPHSGATKEPERSHSEGERSHQGATPSPHVPPRSPLSAIERAAQPLAALGATEREIEWIIGKINADPTIRKKAGWLRQVITNGDGLDQIMEARQVLAATERPQSRAADADPGGWPPGRTRSWPPWCRDVLCNPLTSLREKPNGSPDGLCPDCHPATVTRRY